MASATLISELRGQLAMLPAGPILVGFSGGMDSTVLLHALASLAPVRERGLRALHVDHGLHADSARWAQHCQRIAAALEIACERVALGGVDLAGSGIEGAARAARYTVLGEHLRVGEILATAQHADDQAETVLLKLLRGSGPQGLGGIRVLRAFGAGQLWRPLLNLPRCTLRDYAHAHNLHWIDDPSNADTRLRRNFLRAEILPRLARHWPDASVAIAHSAAWSRAAADYIDGEARLELARLQGADPATLHWREWLALPDALRDPVLRRWLRDRELDEPAHFHVLELQRQLAGKSERSQQIRWGNCEIRRYRDLIHAMRPLAQHADANWSVAWTGACLPLPRGGTLALLDVEAGLPSRSCATLTVSYRRGGERIRPERSTHTRELRLLLQEAGIPPWERERIPLISADAQLIAVGDLILSREGRELLEQARARIVWERTASSANAAPARSHGPIDSHGPLE